MRASARPGFLMAFALADHAAGLFSGRSNTMKDTAAVFLRSYPIDLRISFDDWMIWIDHDYLIPEIFSILGYPIGIECD